MDVTFQIIFLIFIIWPVTLYIAFRWGGFEEGLNKDDFEPYWSIGHIKDEPVIRRADATPDTYLNMTERIELEKKLAEFNEWLKLKHNEGQCPFMDGKRT